MAKPKFQTANLMVHIATPSGNGSGTIVPRYDVTAAEAAVLMLIHGDDSLSEISITGEVERSHREERDRLAMRYQRSESGRDASPVNVLYPGAAARLFERYDELEIDESFFKATGRESAGGAPVKTPRKAKKKAKADEPAAPDAPTEDEADEDDGVEAINDEFTEKDAFA